MKMYICVKKDVPDNFVPVICAHAGMIAAFDFAEHPNFKLWRQISFKKCVVAVNEKEWEKAKQEPDYTILTESNLGGREVAMVFCPRHEWPKVFQFMQLWRPQNV